MRLRARRRDSAGFFLLVATLSAQSKLDWKAVEAVEMQLKLNRSSYVPGEALRLTLSIHNPTNRALTIPEPFRASHGEFTAYRDNPALGYQQSRLAPEPYRIGDRQEVLMGEVVRVEAGATLVREISGSELYSGGLGSGSGLFGSVPCEPGPYGISYGYGLRKSAVARFTVVEAELADHQRQELPKVLYSFRYRPEVQLTPSVATVVLRAGGQFVLLTKENLIKNSEQAKAGAGEFKGYACRLLQPLVRLDESPGRIQVSIKPSSEGRTLVEWTRTGKEGKVRQHEIRTAEIVERAVREAAADAKAAEDYLKKQERRR